MATQEPSETPDWLDAVASRRLTGEALAQWRQRTAGDPKARARLNEDLALNQALDALPAATVSSNFLARVEARIAREESGDRRRPPAAWRWWRWRPAGAWGRAAAVALAAGWTWRQQEVERREFASRLAALSATVGLPGVESLDDFETVRWLQASAAPGDVDLLAVLDAEP